ncbi:hypothetical protein BDQ17DRAFT_1508058 [Cyathus striatus]|nr:hypothetical protein BDQ17DRAFT_1508058 [Cyathus striatus]
MDEGHFIGNIPFGCLEPLRKFPVLLWTGGVLAACIVYGATTAVSIIYLHLVWNRIAAKKPFGMQQKAMVLYTVVGCCLSTVGVIADFKSVAKYIVMSACSVELDDLVTTVGLGGNICFMLTACTSEMGCHPLFYIASNRNHRYFKFNKLNDPVTGSLAIRNLIGDGNHSNYEFTTYFEALSLAHNLTMTCLIVGRLLIYRYKAQKSFGDIHCEPEYLSIVAIIVESQGIFVIGQVLFVIFGSIVTSRASYMYPILAQLQVLVPVILIYQITQGKDCDMHIIAKVKNAVKIANEHNNGVVRNKEEAV